MFGFNLKISLRHLWKNGFYSIIHLLSLTIGITAFLLIFLFIRFELSFDRFHENADQLYRVNFLGKLGDQEIHTSASPKHAAPTFTDELLSIENYCRLRKYGEYVVRTGEHKFKEESIVFADSTFFELFSFPLHEGDPATALTRPDGVVITRRTAQKYFGDQPALGKILTMDDVECQVTGVMENIPSNSHFRFDFFRALSGLKVEWDESWGSTNYQTYLQLKQGADPEKLSTEITASFIKHFSPELREFMNVGWNEFIEAGNYVRLDLVPVTDIHLKMDMDEELGVNGSIHTLYILGCIAFFILILAVVNFVNLTTARSAIRAKEIGVRKVNGATRKNLIVQFLSESFLSALLSLVISIFLIILVLPGLNHITGREFVFSDLIKPDFILVSLILTLGVGFLSGAYPAFLLSSFSVAPVLKGVFYGNLYRTPSGFRNGLVVFQFVITTLLIIGSLVVREQNRFIWNKELGFNRENVLIVQDAFRLGNQFEAFKETMLRYPGVRSACASSAVPVSLNSNTSSIVMGRQVNQENTLLIHHHRADFDYFKTMGIEFVAGRDFSREFPTDSTAVIINETLAKSYGYPQENVIGKEVNFVQSDASDLDIHTIVGVVKDYHFLSLRQEIKPLAVFRDNTRSMLSFRIETSEVNEVVREMEKNWSGMAPTLPLNFVFLDDRFSRLYEHEVKAGEIIRIFTFLAVFLASFGLLGLVSYTIRQRTREIGIRKVLGANTRGLVALLSVDFLKLLVVSLLLAIPVGWFTMNRWLQDFAYRIEISWHLFLIAGLISVFTALMTMGFFVLRAALANPVESLKQE